ncbi:hypothetical protein AD12_4981 [Escherichia coli 1-392-07_S4_C2]|nr:hypothetical protein AD12_4981 [Escherichia coli 1-392-07_S4_C2]
MVFREVILPVPATSFFCFLKHPGETNNVSLHTISLLFIWINDGK